MATNPAEIKIHLFREIDKLPEQYLMDLQKLIYNYLSNIKTHEVAPTTRRLGLMKGLVSYMAPDFNAPLSDFESYM
jgi:hypothetical protein